MSIQQANAEIAVTLLGAVRERHRREHGRRAMAIIDGMIAELEELHLDGGKRVPDRFAERLEDLNAVLPPELRRELRCRVTIVHLMDALFEIQDELLCREGRGSLCDGDGAPGAGLLPRASPGVA